MSFSPPSHPNVSPPTLPTGASPGLTGAVQAGPVPTGQTLQTPSVAAPPGRVSTGAKPPTPAPTTTPNLHCWAKFRPRPQDAYDGEYGFDWIDWKRDPNRRNDEMTEVVGYPISTLSHCFDQQQQKYLPIAKDKYLRRKLQEKYNRLEIYAEDYYVGWLSLRPRQEVKLQLVIEALNKASVKGDYLTFKANANYQVTVDGKVNQAIRIIPTVGSNPNSKELPKPQLVDITVKCLRPGPATALKVLDEEGKLVGKLNVVSNERTYHLPVRVVYVVKDGISSFTDLYNLRFRFSGLRLDNYLNKKCLNQAHIQVEFEKTNRNYEIIFKQTEWVDKYYDVKNNWLTDYVERDPKTRIPIGKTYVLDKILADYIAKYESKGMPSFRGILIIITDIEKDPADDQGGVSRVRPVNFREVLVFGSSIDDQPTYAHEIGHALGLDHVFIENNTNSELEEAKIFIKAQVAYIDILHKSQKYFASSIKKNQDAIARSRAKLQAKPSPTIFEKQQIELDIQHHTKLITLEQKIVDDNEKSITEAEQPLYKSQQELLTFPDNAFKFTQATTDNFMDYYNSPKRLFHWQWKIIQHDVASYYGR